MRSLVLLLWLNCLKVLLLWYWLVEWHNLPHNEMIIFLWTSECLVSIRPLAFIVRDCCYWFFPVAIKVEPVGRSECIGEPQGLPDGWWGVSCGGQWKHILATLDGIAVIEELAVCIVDVSVGWGLVMVLVPVLTVNKRSDPEEAPPLMGVLMKSKPRARSHFSLRKSKALTWCLQSKGAKPS